MDPSVQAAPSGAPPTSPVKEKTKRGYRACLHCRSRKAKCDLGDIDAPSSPPCSRCRRESRECVFAPSRRGGNNKRRRDGDGSSAAGDTTGLQRGYSWDSGGMGGAGPSGTGASASSTTGIPSYTAHVDVLNPQGPSPKADYLFNHPSVSSTDSPQGRSPAHSTSHSHSALQPTPGSGAGSSVHAASVGHHHRDRDQREHQHREREPGKRRRLHLGASVHKSDPSSIVVADMQNESDALHILALASAGRPPSAGKLADGRDRHGRNRSDSRPATPAKNVVPARIEDFALVRLGIVDEEQVTRLVAAFFRFYHHLFPMVPADRIPRTPDQLARFACNERYLVTGMVIIASRNDRAPGMRDVHDRAWKVMRGWIGEIVCLGAPPTVGLVEALLLLAEFLPRDPTRASTPEPVHALGFGEEAHGSENRQAWMLIGMAIRCAYGLGIDKLALKLIPEVDRTFEVERARLVWTYCYLFDRHISLRLGKAFWSRGPNLCFQGFSASAQTGPTAAPGNFPYLREIHLPPPTPGADPIHQEDLASLTQTYLELTQLMSNAHDVLYPNAARTRSLVVYGEYFKYIDELARSLDGFRILWREKKWKLFPLTDAMWAMFYYTQLYITAFSFQAHVERAAMRAEEEYQEHDGDGPRPSLSLFPRGAAASPDARYIFTSIDAARQLLHICCDSLHPGGALPYLPNRFLLWFTYAAIVLLKALYSGAMLRADHAAAHKLIDRLVECFADASPDDDHPAVRYAHQLQALRQKLAGMATSANSPTGGNTVPLPAVEREMEREREARDRTGSGSSAVPGSTRVPDGSDPRDAWIDTAADTWSFPAPPALNNSGAPISFPYSVPPTAAGAPGYIAPPHQQPLSEIVAPPLPRDAAGNGASAATAAAIANNLGFATLDDWFGNTGQPQQPAGNGGGFEALDLADFWMKVGPGEAQGGFPFR